MNGMGFIVGAFSDCAPFSPLRANQTRQSEIVAFIILTTSSTSSSGGGGADGGPFSSS